MRARLDRFSGGEKADSLFRFFLFTGRLRALHARADKKNVFAERKKAFRAYVRILRKTAYFLRVRLFFYLSFSKKEYVRQREKFFAVANCRMFYKIYEK